MLAASFRYHARMNLRAMVLGSSGLLLVACGLPGASDGGSTGGAWPLQYEGTATLRRTLHINFDDMSTIECRSTGAWTATVTKDTVTITGKVDKRATFAGGTTLCETVTDSVIRTGSHDGEKFTLTFNYESTPVSLRGSFGATELLGSYDATWTGTVAGFGTITKTEDVSLALPLKP